jgi:hypothetical protein
MTRESATTLCSTAEQVVYSIIVGAAGADIEAIAKRAMEDKERFFLTNGWDVNHKIDKGDVRCVLQAIVSVACERMKNGASK